MIKKYKAKKKGIINYLTGIFLILPIFVLAFKTDIFAEAPYKLLLLVSPLTVLLWLRASTFYVIENTSLKYRSGFIKGEIEISGITQIKYGTMWIGIKPALASNGLVIKYNRSDEIYIAPENNDQFVADVLSINTSIEVIANS